MKAIRSSFFLLLSVCIGFTITAQISSAQSGKNSLPTAPQEPTASGDPVSPSFALPSPAPESNEDGSPALASPQSTVAPVSQPTQPIQPTQLSPTVVPVEKIAAPSAPRSADVAPKIEPPVAPKNPKAHKSQRDDDDHDDDDEDAGLGDNHVLPGPPVHDVVSLFGNSLAESEVDGVVVSIFGNSEARERVSEAVVAVFGNTRAAKEVGESAVAVFGNVDVQGHVHENVVAVFGDVNLGSTAEVDGNVLSVGGLLRRDPGAIVHGHVTAIPVFGHSLHLGGFSFWFQHCVFSARLLAFHSSLIWAWVVAFLFLGAYALVALAFSGGVTRCAETFEQRPGWTILATLITAVLTPVLLALLMVTILGGFFLALALLLGAFFGKAAFYAWLGRRFHRVPGPAGTAVAVLLGGAMAILLFTVPVIGLVVWMVSGMLGLGMVVYTLILSMKRPATSTGKMVQTQSSVPPIRPSATVPMAPSVGSESPSVSSPVLETKASESLPATDPISTPLPPLPPLHFTPIPPIVPIAPPRTPPPAVSVSAFTLPRASFGIRLAAAALDLVLVCLLAHLIHLDKWFLLLYTVYCVVMWSWKATTIGGVICGLKIVRLDDRPLDWQIALIRALGAFLSAVVFGLGFLWVIFDDQSQSWHDKIAGTTIVQVPKGVSLI